MKLEPFEEACKITNQLIKEVESNGFTIKTIDVGGGIGIDENEKFKFIEYFNLINSYFEKKDRTIIFEPGRTIIGNTSILVSKILYIKETEDKIFVVIDAGMNDFMRPALYGATHEILPILQSETKKNKVIEFVGPICETSDKFLTLDSFQNINEGDFIAISNTGAYGSSMSSNYNVRPNIAEILINKNKFSTIRKRQNLEDLISE